MPVFIPHPLLRNRHAMTLAAALLPRRTPRLPPAQDRLFETEPDTRLLVKCHWQARPRECPTIIAVHGLEGSSESPYMRGLAEKAFLAGFNVLRMNQRNCGGTERLTPTVYNSGLSGDCRAVLNEAITRDGLPAVFLVGYSMGGNLVFKMAGELGNDAPSALRGVCGVCPTIELAACADALEKRENVLYQWHFVRRLKARMRRKASLFPERYRLTGLDRVRTVREFDDLITAPCCGYRDAADYYDHASAARVADRIAVPALVVTAQDDPIVPVQSIQAAPIAGNPYVRVMAPEFGGHCGFISRTGGAERYWAEARVMEFCGAPAIAVAEPIRSDRR